MTEGISSTFSRNECGYRAVDDGGNKDNENFTFDIFRFPTARIFAATVVDVYNDDRDDDEG